MVVSIIFLHYPNNGESNGKENAKMKWNLLYMESYSDCMVVPMSKGTQIYR